LAELAKREIIQRDIMKSEMKSEVRIPAIAAEDRTGADSFPGSLRQPFLSARRSRPLALGKAPLAGQRRRGNGSALGR
jgi:hypothetical protein